ncbi:unnamed protein product [Darwinula stevensoni]|uniref:Uncharacterized protein n=1 Tax=Darwinula stevensoni TaxID=69355 RepID=A0A7R9A946_9CRUS|nr:unnamed protein product [Darwinula stevensoni]CAG0896954.1 unnamed protein product [Darwinula stevensoni]
MAARAHIASLLLLVLLQWSSVDGQCGGDFTEPTGIFSSPNYPSNYTNNVNCSYTIEVAPGHGIRLLLVDFVLENCCTCDKVTVYHPSTGVTDTLCEPAESFEILEQSPSLLVTFRTDHSVVFRGFLAEYESFPILPEECGEAWLEFNGACYKFINEPRTALGAQLECESLGANLTSIHGDDENLFIGVHAPSSPLWIGLQRQGSDWEWTDGSPFDYGKFNPNFLSQDGFAYMWMDQWGNDDCTEAKAFVCRLRSTDCPTSSWIQEGPDCYLVVDVPMSFDAAVQFCQDAIRPSTLFTLPADVDYNDVVAFVFNGPERQESTEFWIGYERDVSSDWNWIDGSSSAEEFWFPGFPDANLGRCAYVFLNAWDDFPPNHAFPFACKKGLSKERELRLWLGSASHSTPLDSNPANFFGYQFGIVSYSYHMIRKYKQQLGLKESLFAKERKKHSKNGPGAAFREAVLGPKTAKDHLEHYNSPAEEVCRGKEAAQPRLLAVENSTEDSERALGLARGSIPLEKKKKKIRQGKTRTAQHAEEIRSASSCGYTTRGIETFLSSGSDGGEGAGRGGEGRDPPPPA